MSGRKNLLPSGSDVIWMGAEIRLTFCSCHIEQKGILYRIFYEDRLKRYQYSLVWEVSLRDKLKDEKPQV